eukprot:sb/3477727/
MNASVLFSLVHFVLVALGGFGASVVSPSVDVLGPAVLWSTVRSTIGRMFSPVAAILCSAISCGVTMFSDFSIDLNWPASFLPGTGSYPLSSHRRSSLFQDVLMLQV